MNLFDMRTIDKEGITFYEFYDGYWISKCGQFASMWTKGRNSHVDISKWYQKKLIPKPDKRKGYRGGYVEVTIYPYRRDIPRLQEMFLVHDIQDNAGFQTTVNPDRIRITIKVHRLLMILFKPFVDNCDGTGITKEDFLATPPNVQKLLVKQMVIDHIDHNRANNKLENLRWVTSHQNAQNRVNYARPVSSTRKHYNELTHKEKTKLGHLGRPHSCKRKHTPYLDKERIDPLQSKSSDWKLKSSDDISPLEAFLK